MKRQGHVKMVSLEHGKKRKKTPMTLQPYFSPSPNQRVKDYVFGSQEKNPTNLESRRGCAKHKSLWKASSVNLRQAYLDLKSHHH